MNISSVIVDVRPGHVTAVQQSLHDWPELELHATTPDGRLIVTVETSTDGQTTDAFARLQATEGVMSVALVYHQFEPDPDTEVLHGSDPS